MIAIRGAGSRIAQELVKLLPKGEAVAAVDRQGKASAENAERYLFCAGLLRPRALLEQRNEEIAESYWVNAVQVIADCERIIDQNPLARVCVIGSESAFTGSFDGAYATAKAALHRYVETKKLRTADQQLICIAPSIVGDAGMTVGRSDTSNLNRRRREHPKRRFIDSAEVARLVHHVLYVDRGYLSGIVIRMNGGEHTCR